MNTLIYGGCDPLVFKKLEKHLFIKCTIHSIKNLKSDYSNAEIIKENFKKTPIFSEEGQQFYQEFFRENFIYFNKMIVRRGLFLSDFHDLRDEFSLYFHSLLEILKKEKIQLIIFFSFPHEGPDYILYKLAKLLKINTLLCYQSIFPNRFFIISDIDNFGKIEKNTKNYNFEYLFDQEYNYKSSLKKYVNQLSGNYNSIFYHFIKSRRKIKFLLIYILNIIGILNRKDPYKEYVKNLNNIKINNLELNNILKNKKKKFYFPLQFQPELSTSLLAKDFEDQILILERLQIYSKNEWDIIAKDNPRQSFYQRGKFFFKRLKYLKNVYFVDSNYDSNELISKTDVTVTSSGTPGWEAIKKRKKVLLFGSAWYSDIHGCLKVNNKTADSEINKFLNQSYNENQFKSDFNSILSQSYEGIIDFGYISLYKLKNFDENNNSDLVVKNILNYIKENLSIYEK